MLFERQTFKITFNYKTGKTSDKKATDTYQEFDIPYNTGFGAPGDTKIYTFETYLKKYDATIDSDDYGWHDEKGEKVTNFGQIKVTQNLKYTLQYKETDIYHIILYKSDTISTITPTPELQRFYIEKNEEGTQTSNSQTIKISTSEIVKKEEEDVVYNYEFLGWILNSQNDKVQEDDNSVTNGASILFGYSNSSTSGYISVVLQFNDYLISLCSKENHELKLRPGYNYIHKKYTVSFYQIEGGNWDNISAGMAYKSAPIEKNYFYGEAISARDLPKLSNPEGFTYTGKWKKGAAYKEGDGAGDDLSKITVTDNSTKLYAVWYRNEYTVYFNYMDEDASGITSGLNTGNTMYLGYLATSAKNFPSAKGLYGSEIDISNTQYERTANSKNHTFTFQSWHSGNDTDGSKVSTQKNKVYVRAGGTSLSDDNVYKAKYKVSTRKYKITWRVYGFDDYIQQVEYNTDPSSKRPSHWQLGKIYEDSNKQKVIISELPSIKDVTEDTTYKADVRKYYEDKYFLLKDNTVADFFTDGYVSTTDTASLNKPGIRNYSLVGIDFTNTNKIGRKTWKVRAKYNITLTSNSKNIKAVLTYVNAGTGQNPPKSTDIAYNTEKPIDLTVTRSDSQDFCNKKAYYIGIKGPLLTAATATATGIEFWISYDNESISY